MTEEVNPAVLELIEFGNGFGGIRVDGKTREETRANLLAALEQSKQRYRNKADRPHEPLSAEITDKVVEESVKYFTDLAHQREQSE